MLSATFTSARSINLCITNRICNLRYVYFYRNTEFPSFVCSNRFLTNLLFLSNGELTSRNKNNLKDIIL